MLDEKISEMPQPGLDPDLLDDGIKVTEMQDGSVEVDMEPDVPEAEASFDIEEGHYKNLADGMDKTELGKIGQEVCNDVTVDETSREEWRGRLKNGLDVLGITHKRGADLEIAGMSTVTYPLISEAMVQFNAKAQAEIFPATGPVKTSIIGTSTKEKREQAQRIQDHMNFQVTVQDKAFFWNVDKMLFLLPFFGSTFKKTYYDVMKKMVVSRYISPLDLIVPYLADSIETADRYTHKITLSEVELEQMIRKGFYLDLGLPDQEDIRESRQDLEDIGDERGASVGDDDNSYTLYEQAKYCKLEDDEYIKPYLVTVNRETEEVLSIRRNWKEDDEDFNRIEWVTHYKFLPGLGFYGFGLMHLIGSLAEATTGTIRSMLDSAAFSNFQGGFVSSDIKIKEKGGLKLAMGEWKQVPSTSEDLQKAFYTPPFKRPSPAMAQVFQILVDAGRRFSSTTENQVGDASNNGPVGTTMALIEQGSKVFSGIHRRVHASAAAEFQIIADLNYLYLDDKYAFATEGKEMEISREDYDGRIDVVPVSDPNIFSSTQRIVQAQSLVQLQAENPDMLDKKVVLERFLAAMNIPQYQELFIDNEPKRQDPITENAGFLTGNPSKSFKDQAHDAHIQVHMQFMGSLDEETIKMVQPIVMSHVQEHYALKYTMQMEMQLSQVAGQTIALPSPDDKEAQPLTPDQENEIAMMAAQMPPQPLMPQEPDPEQEEKQSEFQMDQEHKQISFQSEEERKQAAFQSEEQRKDAELSGSSQRKDFESESQERRKSAQHEGDEVRKDEQFAEDVDRKASDHEFDKALEKAKKKKSAKK